MKALASIVILSVIVCGAQAQATVGNCTIPVYIGKLQPCQTTFIHDLQKNPKSDCSAELQALIKCGVKVAKSCFSHLGMSDAVLTSIMQKTLTKDLMCDKAGLQYPSNTAAVNATLPCSISMAEYMNHINNCSDKLLKMWQANRADPRTCMEYKMTKVCIRKVIKDGNCKTTGEFEEMMKLSLGKYNPFCPTNVDPTSAPGQTTQVTQSTGTGTDHTVVGPTSTSPQTSFSSYFLFMLVAMLVNFLV